MLSLAGQARMLAPTPGSRPSSAPHKGAGLAAAVGRHRHHVAALLLKLGHQVLRGGAEVVQEQVIESGVTADKDDVAGSMPSGTACG